MTDGISPEEKLLRLIKKQNKHGNAADKEAVVTGAGSGPAIKFSPANLLKKYLSFLFIQKLIVPVFAASFIYLIISFIYPLFNVNTNKFMEIAQGKTAELMKEPAGEIKPYEFYLEGIKSKKIFNAASSEGPSSSINDAESFKGLNLVGIISGDNPQAIIEDKAVGKTYSINKGQFIGEFCIDDIQEGKVILNRNGQKLELFL